MKGLLITAVIINGIAALMFFSGWVYARVYKDVECCLDILKALIHVTLAVLFALQLSQL